MLWAVLSLTVVIYLVAFSLCNGSQFKYLVSTESQLCTQIFCFNQ